MRLLRERDPETIPQQAETNRDSEVRKKNLIPYVPQDVACQKFFEVFCYISCFRNMDKHESIGYKPITLPQDYITIVLISWGDAVPWSRNLDHDLLFPVSMFWFPV